MATNNRKPFSWKSFSLKLGSIGVHQCIGYTEKNLQNNLIFRGSILPHKIIHKATWLSPDIQHYLYYKSKEMSWCDRSSTGTSYTKNKVGSKEGTVDEQKTKIQQYQSSQKYTDEGGLWFQLNFLLYTIFDILLKNFDFKLKKTWIIGHPMSCHRACHWKSWIYEIFWKTWIIKLKTWIIDAPRPITRKTWI